MGLSQPVAAAVDEAIGVVREPAMCLAIPGRIVSMGPEPHLAVVEVSKVRRQINVDLLKDDGVGGGRLGADPRRLRDDEDQRCGSGRAAAAAGDAGRRRSRRCASSKGTGSMKMTLTKFRDPALIRRAADEIRRLAAVDRHFRIMEVCGGHTHAIYRFGARRSAAAERRADSWARMPGLRAADGPRRRRVVAGRRARRDLHRRSAT